MWLGTSSKKTESWSVTRWIPLCFDSRRSKRDAFSPYPVKKKVHVKIDIEGVRWESSD